MTRAAPSRLDIDRPEALASYLVEHGYVPREQALTMRRLPGGVSSRTILVQHGERPDWVIKQALDQLRVSVPWHCDPARAHREAQGLRWLHEVAPGSVPAFLFEDQEHNLLAMEAVPTPYATLKELLLAGRIDEAMLADFGRLLSTIHLRGADRDAAREFADRSYFEALRLEPYYSYTAGREPTAAPFLSTLVDETRRTRLTVVHGDYSPKNVLVHDRQLVLVDHEVIHFGDPAFDIGFASAHLLSKAHHLPAHRAQLASGALLFWTEYRRVLQAATWANNLEPRAVRHTLGCLLARVLGRSPLEYLDAAQRKRQRVAALALISRPPNSIAVLVDEFLEQVG